MCPPIIGTLASSVVPAISQGVTAATSALTSALPGVTPGATPGAAPSFDLSKMLGSLGTGQQSGGQSQQPPQVQQPGMAPRPLDMTGLMQIINNRSRLGS